MRRLISAGEVHKICDRSFGLVTNERASLLRSCLARSARNPCIRLTLGYAYAAGGHEQAMPWRCSDIFIRNIDALESHSWIKCMRPDLAASYEAWRSIPVVHLLPENDGDDSRSFMSLRPGILRGGLRLGFSRSWVDVV